MKSWVQSSASHMPGTVMEACSLKTQEAEAGGLKAERHIWNVITSWIHVILVQKWLWGGGERKDMTRDEKGN